MKNNFKNRKQVSAIHERSIIRTLEKFQDQVYQELKKLNELINYRHNLIEKNIKALFQSKLGQELTFPNDNDHSNICPTDKSAVSNNVDQSLWNDFSNIPTENSNVLCTSLKSNKNSVASYNIQEIDNVKETILHSVVETDEDKENKIQSKTIEIKEEVFESRKETGDSGINTVCHSLTFIGKETFLGQVSAFHTDFLENEDKSYSDCYIEPNIIKKACFDKFKSIENKNIVNSIKVDTCSTNNVKQHFVSTNLAKKLKNHPQFKPKKFVDKDKSNLNGVCNVSGDISLKQIYSISPEEFSKFSSNRVNKNKFKHLCNLCKKSFMFYSLLKAHKCVYAYLKSHKCIWCGKGFYSYSSYVSHLMKHLRKHVAIDYNKI